MALSGVSPLFCLIQGACSTVMLDSMGQIENVIANTGHRDSKRSCMLSPTTSFYDIIAHVEFSEPSVEDAVSDRVSHKSIMDDCS